MRNARRAGVVLRQPFSLFSLFSLSFSRRRRDVFGECAADIATLSVLAIVDVATLAGNLHLVGAEFIDGERNDKVLADGIGRSSGGDAVAAQGPQVVTTLGIDTDGVGSLDFHCDTGPVEARDGVRRQRIGEYPLAVKLAFLNLELVSAGDREKRTRCHQQRSCEKDKFLLHILILFFDF